MTETMDKSPYDGNFIFTAETHEDHESQSSSDIGQGSPLTPPSLRSYSSLELRSSCTDVDDDNCRLIKLTNTIKKLVDLIGDPTLRGDTPTVRCLLRKLLEYNGTDGFYLHHLPQIGEILEFLSMRAKESDEYPAVLERLLSLCSLPPRLRRSSEILGSTGNLKRHFSLLGYLLGLAPTRCHFLLAKGAIERLMQPKRRQGARNTVKRDALLGALEDSRLSVTLAELVGAASWETYPVVLELVLAVVSASTVCCFKMLEAGVENELLLRMHPAYGLASECLPVTDDGDLYLEREDYCGAAELAAGVLGRLMTAVIFASELPGTVRQLEPPSEAAMWSLKAAFRRAVLLSKQSSRNRELRNNLANLLLASLMRSKTATSWDLMTSGLVEDLADLSVATEFGEACDMIETSSREALAFKKTVLLSVALVAQIPCDGVHRMLKNRNLVRGLLQLINPNRESTKVPWNSAQLRHLFKYATNALSHLVPEIPEEFIENDGSLRLLEMLERYVKTGSEDDALVTCLVETICALSVSNCRSILDNFGEHAFVPVMLQQVTKTLDSENLSSHRQRLVTLLLTTSENIIANKTDLCECHCDLIVGTAVDLMQRCLDPKNKDSELEQSYLGAIASFVWKCTTSCSRVLEAFLKHAGLYLVLDIMETANLAVQSFYLALLSDICSSTDSCDCFIFTWRLRADKNRGLLSLLANIWRDEEEALATVWRRGVCQGRVESTESPLMNDNQLYYVYFTKSLLRPSSIALSATGAARPKIYYLHELIKIKAENYENLFQQLCIEDQITLLRIDAYARLKEDEAELSISRLLEHVGLRPLTRASEPLRSVDQKISGWGTRVLERQTSLQAEHRAVEVQAERDQLHRIHEAGLASAFDALEKTSFIARTSSKEYKLTKVEEIRNEMNRSEMGPEICRTLDWGAGFTNVFNQHVRVQSIRKECLEKATSNISLDSAASSLIDASECTSASYKSESSFLLKNYRFDPSGRIFV